MHWFKGLVSEAIAEAKKNNGIFMVFIYDKSELSQTAKEKINTEEVTETLSSLKYVAIEIENGSNDAIQFAQIYPLIVIPSLFFISPQTGVPLEVIAGNIDTGTLASKLKTIGASVQKDNSSPSPIESSDVPKCAQEDITVKEATVEKKEGDETSSSVSSCLSGSVSPVELCGEDKESSQVATSEVVPESTSTTTTAVPESTSSITTAVPESTSITSTTAVPESTSTTPSAALPVIEERIERAKELISNRQELKANEEMEDEKQKELDRRRQNSEVAKAKQKREDQERIDLGRQRKKDKEEDRLARERVKAQIAADRADRLARISILKGEEPPAVSRPIQEPSPPVVNQQPPNQRRNDVTRIKFRFSDNSSELSQFSTNATLQDVQNYLIENGKVSCRRFKLIGTLPPRAFSDADMPVTLLELGLTPSAIIIVKPVTAGSSTSLEPIRKSVILFIWTMFSPLIVLFEYLRGFLGFGSRGPARTEPSSDDEDTQSKKRPRTEGSYTTRNRPNTAFGNRGDRENFSRREGNIHRLPRVGDDEDDDENNTWNGNSTQQM